MEILLKKQIDFEDYVDINPHILIEAINELDIKYRWSFIALILNNINLTELNSLTDSQKDIIKKYLNIQLNRFA